jgi:hypothetical protein
MLLCPPPPSAQLHMCYVCLPTCAYLLNVRCFVSPLRMALGSDASVHELLLSLVERLGHEQEVGWLDALTQEMVGLVDQLMGAPTVSAPFEQMLMSTFIVCVPCVLVRSCVFVCSGYGDPKIFTLTVPVCVLCVCMLWTSGCGDPEVHTDTALPGSGHCDITHIRHEGGLGVRTA